MMLHSSEQHPSHGNYTVLFLVGRDFLNPHKAGGDIYMSELANLLAKKGFKVFMISHASGKKNSVLYSNGIWIFRVAGLFSYPLRVFNIYLRYFRGNVRVVFEDIIGGFRLPSLAKLYIKEKIIVVLHQRNKPIFYAQFNFFLAFLSSLIEYLVSLVYRNALVLTPSFKSALDVSRLGFRKIRVLHPLVRFKCSESDYLDYNERNLIVFIGVLRRYKCPHHIIQALKIIKDTLPPKYKLVIAGKVSDYDRGYIRYLFKLIREYELSDRVIFRINISEEEKKELLKRALCLIVPSPIEGFSIVSIEANRCGTPVIASEGVPEEVVVDYVNGLRYRYGNINELAEKIYKLALDIALWRNLSRAALTMSRGFSEEAVEEKVARIINGGV